jgi:hypothetical protein
MNEYNIEFDYYKLYLAIDYQYVDKIYCESLEQVEFELNRAVGYNKYLVIGHSNSLDMDQVVAQGELEVNRTRRRR